MDLTKRVNDVIIEPIQDRGSTPLQSTLPDGVIGGKLGTNFERVGNVS